MEVLLPISYIKVVIALLLVAAIAWQCARVVWLLNDIICVTVLHGFVIPMIKRHRILVIDVQVGWVLVQEESARATRWKGDRALQMRVKLHVLGPEDGITSWVLSERYLVAEKGVIKEIEVIAVRGLVFDAAVAFVAVQVDQVRIVLTIVEAVCCAGVALLEQ